MSVYKTPGVYVEEIDAFPPSVVQVSTAIPAFIGYTEQAKDGNGKDIEKFSGNVAKPTRITSMLEFKALFGGADKVPFSVKVQNGSNVGGESIELSVEPSDTSFNHLMYYCVQHYFLNGGGACYIISTGNFKAVVAEADYTDALGALKSVDEVTLILLTDAVNLNPTQYHATCEAALSLCASMKDRFAVLDVIDSKYKAVLNSRYGLGAAASSKAVKNDISPFRNAVNKNLDYGASYYPYLETSLIYQTDDDQVSILGETNTSPRFSNTLKGLKITYSGKGQPVVNIVEASALGIEVDNSVLTINLASGGKSAADIVKKWGTPQDEGGFVLTEDTGGTGDLIVPGDTVKLNSEQTGESLTELKASNTGLYNQIKAELGKQRVILPPSAATVGVYVRTDADRGVWKAPANTALSAVIDPLRHITDQIQNDMNIDATSGKSINAIRAFTGKGTLVWGARTLAGNDNNWRFINVRRLFLMVEESCQKATEFAVFEANDPSTWIKVKAMLQGYFYQLWQKGAFVGATADDAYFVHIGLGVTMTEQDILEGRMIVEVGIAPTRPAEFIVLRFTQKIQS